ncbi:hypothetical protein C8R32_1041 [Nitrosospira sp. Nsp5]|uniref:HEPN AbiU2-like domain-containing protein n=1 Tax=Nitrosospira multiformis TaxID=1231 RepID=A0ABY0TDK0_9PROT|nr:MULTISPECIES: hypothetical protein [Nitrosospira]PTR08923.1 hypothetical protein C8R32_1041 [Nitrosospira sp. Nsp5]SDQ67010.1 hypothetical protein SAMN05216402_1781 [Nitrosospira multiformis]
MKFKIGDTTDTALCIVLKHEFLRCEDSFNDFAESAKIMIMQGENRRIAYKTYNAYARFIHHLYEFMIGAIARDRQNTEKLPSEMADKYIASHTQRNLTNRREAILNGTAGAWENHISFYPEKVPDTFAEEFRKFRNKVSAHVNYERSDLSLSDFYEKNHKYLGLLYFDVKSWWGRLENEFPDLKEITSFSVLIKDTPLSKLQV